MSNNTETVRAAFEAYRAQDRARMEALLAEDFVFTSPQDDHIDKAAFMRECFPTTERLTSQRTVHLVDADGDDVFILYEYTLKTGETHRTVECITVRDGKLAETQVFFGGRVG